MNKKLSILAVSVAMVLAGCNSSDDSNNQSKQTHTLTAIDGFLHKAEVWIDADGDYALNQLIDLKVTELTDEKGQVVIAEEHKNKAVFVRAIRNQTIDMSRGLVEKDFGLAATAGSTVANPMTNLVVQMLESDDSLSESDAKQAVVTAVTSSGSNSGLVVSEELIFGDYISDTSQEADALNAIGEALVDKADANLSIEQQLAVTTVVAEKAKAVINSNGSLEDFAPVVTVPDSPDDEITADVNHRPTVSGSLEDIAIELGQPIPSMDITGIFSDKDINNTLTYTMAALNGTNALTLSGTSISGTPTKAGHFEYHIFATDKFGAKSYPAKLKLTVTSPNHVPTVNDDKKIELAGEIANLHFEQNQTVTQTINITNLFTDVDGDELAIKAQVANHALTAKVNANELTLSGTPTQHGVFKLTLSASDNIAAEEATAEFEVTIIEAVEPLPPQDHPLVGQALYFLEWGNKYEDHNYKQPRIWCDSTLYKDNKVFTNTRTLNNLTTCSAPTTEIPGASYTIKDGELNVSRPSEDNPSETVEFKLKVVKDNASEDIASSAKTVIFYGPNETERYTYFSKLEEAEARINIQSEDTWDKRAATIYLPGKTENTWEPITVSVAIDTNRAYMNFDAKGKNFSCEAYEEWYSIRQLTDGNNSYPGSCTTQNDNNPKETQYDYANVSFDLSHVDVNKDTVYSFISSPSEDERQYTESIKLNIKWTGETNNE